MPTLLGVLHEGNVTSRGTGETVILEKQSRYRILADSITQDRIELLATPGLPVSKQTQDANGLTCVDVQIDPETEHRQYFVASVTWSSAVKENNDPNSPQTGNPTEWTPQAEVEFEPIDVVVKQDLDGVRFCNTFGDPFESGLVVPKRVSCRTFVQYEPVGIYAPNWTANTAFRKNQLVTSSGNIYRCKVAGTSSTVAISGTGTSIADGTVTWTYVSPPPSGGVNIHQIEDRCDMMNEVAFLGRAAYTFLLEVRKAAIGYWFGYRCWRIEYAIKYREDGWRHKEWSVGYRYKDGSGNPQVYKLNGVATLAKLNADGTLVADQVAGTPALQTFRNYKKGDYNTFLRCVM